MKMSRTNKLKIHYLYGILLTFIVMVISVGCGYSKEEKAMMEGYEKTARTNAIEYIEGKYGFTPMVTETYSLKVDPGPVPDFFPSATGMVRVKMKYEDTDFTVIITGEETSNDGKDDYQKEELEKAFAERLSQELSINIETIDLLYNNDCMLSERNDNLDTFLESMKEKSLISVSATTFDKIPVDTVKLLNYDGVELLLMSCRNQECLDKLTNIKYIKEHGYRQNFYNIEAMDNKLAEYALFMNGHVFRNEEGKVDCKLYSLNKVADGIYYIYDTYDKLGEVKILETSDMSPISDWSRDAGKDIMRPSLENPAIIGNPYKIDFNGASKVQIFIIEKNKNQNDKAERAVALQYVDEGGNVVYTHEFPSVIEGYYTFSVENNENTRFALMKNIKQK